MPTRKTPVDYELDDDEKDLLESFERGEWKSVKNKKAYLSHAKEASENFFKKDSRINIRISSFDLQHLKRIAAKEGLPYQTLIAMVLHKYADKHI